MKFMYQIFRYQNAYGYHEWVRILIGQSTRRLHGNKLQNN